MIVFAVLLGILIVVSIIAICCLLAEISTLQEKNEKLESDCRTFRNMYFNLKSVKLDDSEWKDMTSSQIAKSIIEQKYKEGELDIEALLNEGRIVEKNNYSSVLIDAFVGRPTWLEGY